MAPRISLTLLFGHFPTVISFPASDQYAFVLESCCSFVTVDKLGEGSVALDKHARIERKSERFGELRYPFGLVFATTICEENKGNAFLR